MNDFKVDRIYVTKCLVVLIDKTTTGSIPLYHRPSLSKAQFVTGPVCHRPRLSQAQFTTSPVCHRPIFSQSPLFTGPLYHRPS